ncbi:hypothetical protein IWA04_002328 [Salmonella enterica]|nr:hypothetical protein [Salmonella enterica]EGP0592044.1 hypothetical protein [Salmonella enterica]EGP1592102.1 hypothetical protein [Salmonella enterica]EHH6524921.1 hypothetical protein [Salmonella enterica]
MKVFPAPAGINRLLPSGPCRAHCVPRASGDKPGGEFGWVFDNECSPRQRG